MSKKVKIYCYKLAKPVAKKLKENLGIGRVECETGFIKEYLGAIYFITTNKLAKKDEIALSNNYKFNYSGSLNKKINYIPYEISEINSSSGNTLVMSGSTFRSLVDPENKMIESALLDNITNELFTEEDKNAEQILNSEPIISQVTIEEQKPIVSTDPLDGPTLVVSPEIFQESIEIQQTIYSENPKEWVEEEFGYGEEDYEDICKRVNELEVENFKLSNKINNTIEELKNMTILDILLWRWKSKLLDILNL